MGAHQNTVQRTVVFILTVIGALLYGALDALVCMAAHSFSSFVRLHPIVPGYSISMAVFTKMILAHFSNIAFRRFLWYSVMGNFWLFCTGNC